MNPLVIEIVAVALRHVSPTTARRSGDLDNFVSVLFTGKSLEIRQAEEIVGTVQNVVKSVQRANTKRKFKLIVKNG